MGCIIGLPFIYSPLLVAADSSHSNFPFRDSPVLHPLSCFDSFISFYLRFIRACLMFIAGLNLSTLVYVDQTVLLLRDFNFNSTMACYTKDRKTEDSKVSVHLSNFYQIQSYLPSVIWGRSGHTVDSRSNGFQGTNPFHLL